MEASTKAFIPKPLSIGYYYLLAPDPDVPDPPDDPYDPGEPVPAAPLELLPEVPLAPVPWSPARRSQPTAAMLNAATTNRIFEVVLNDFILVPFMKN